MCKIISHFKIFNDRLRINKKYLNTYTTSVKGTFYIFKNTLNYSHDTPGGITINHLKTVISRMFYCMCKFCVK